MGHIKSHCGERVVDAEADAEVTPLKYENVSSNVSINLPTPVWSGHKCLGWSLYSYATTADYYCGQAIKPELSATYYAVWEDDGSTPAIESYTVSFNANGGNVTPSTQTVNDGTAITLPTAVKSGFDFLGWSTDSSAASADYAAGESFTVTGNTTFYAVWKKQEITKTALIDSENGVQVEFDRDVFDSSVNVDDIRLNVEKNDTDDEIDKQFNDYQMTRVPNLDIYNIYLTCNGKEIQPNGKVTVRIAYNGIISDISKVKVFHYYKENGSLMSEKIAPVYYSNGYLEFITGHFSNFVFVIENPSVNLSIDGSGEMQYKSTQLLKTNFTDGIEYTSSDPNVAAVDKTTGLVTATGKGTATIKATVKGTDITASRTITVKYAWWQWIIRILLLGFLWY